MLVWEFETTSMEEALDHEFEFILGGDEVEVEGSYDPMRIS